MRRALAILALLPGCAAAPEVDVARFAGRVPPAPEGTPALLPVEAVLEAGPPRAALATPPGGLEGRAAALRARAAGLAGPVIPAPERGRLEAARVAPPSPSG